MSIQAEMTKRLGREPSDDELVTLESLAIGATWDELARRLRLRHWHTAEIWTCVLFAKLGYGTADGAQLQLDSMQKIAARLAGLRDTMTAEEKLDLARRVTEESGGIEVVMLTFHALVENAAGCKFVDVFGPIDTFRTLWVEATARSYAHLMTEAQLEGMLAWFESDVARSLRKLRTPMFAAGETTMAEVIAENTRNS